MPAPDDVGLEFIGRPEEIVRATDPLYADLAVASWPEYLRRTVEASMRAGGRFNPPGEPGAVYTAGDEETAWNEVAAREEWGVTLDDLIAADPAPAQVDACHALARHARSLVEYLRPPPRAVRTRSWLASSAARRASSTARWSRWGGTARPTTRGSTPESPGRSAPAARRSGRGRSGTACDA